MSKVDDIVSQYLHTSSPLKRKLYVFLGLIMTFFAIIGIFIPGWPTVSWAVPAAFLFSLSSERLFRWSLTNRFFGSAILEYYSTGKTIPKHTKYIIATIRVIIQSHFTKYFNFVGPCGHIKGTLLQNIPK